MIFFSFLVLFPFSFFIYCCFFLFRSLLNFNMQPNNKFQKLSYRIVSYRETGLKPKKCQKRKEVSFVPMRYYYFVLLFVQTHTHVFYIFIDRIFFCSTIIEQRQNDFYAERYREKFRNIESIYKQTHVYCPHRLFICKSLNRK